MANNPNVNKVIYDGTTIMDVTDTTATASDVLSGKKFTLANGAKATGSLVTTEYTAGDGIDITNDVISNTAGMYTDDMGTYQSATPINANTLEGHNASYFATQSDISSINANLIPTDYSNQITIPDSTTLMKSVTKFNGYAFFQFEFYKSGLTAGTTTNLLTIPDNLLPIGTIGVLNGVQTDDSYANSSPVIMFVQKSTKQLRINPTKDGNNYYFITGVYKCES